MSQRLLRHPGRPDDHGNSAHDGNLWSLWRPQVSVIMEFRPRLRFLRGARAHTNTAVIMETRRLSQAQTLAVRSAWPPDGTRVKTTRWPALSVKITLLGETNVRVPGW